MGYNNSEGQTSDILYPSSDFYKQHLEDFNWFNSKLWYEYRKNLWLNVPTVRIQEEGEEVTFPPRVVQLSSPHVRSKTSLRGTFGEFIVEWKVTFVKNLRL